MPLDQTTPTERDQIESPRPQESRLPSDPWVLASRVAQVFYMFDPQSNLPPKKKTKHVVASGKQHIIGVDGVDDVESYNNYNKKISVVEKNLPKTYCHGNEKVLREKLLRAKMERTMFV